MIIRCIMQVEGTKRNDTKENYNKKRKEVFLVILFVVIKLKWKKVEIYMIFTGPFAVTEFVWSLSPARCVCVPACEPR